MRRNQLWYAAIAFLAAAAAVIAAGVAYGQLRIAFLLVIPVIYGSGPATVLAAVFVFAAFIMFALAPFRELQRGGADSIHAQEYEPAKAGTQTAGRSRAGGVIFIGPIPIIFGSDRRITGYMIVASVVILVLLIIAYLAGVF